MEKKEKVSAHVILRLSDGSTFLKTTEYFSSKNIKQYKIEEKIMQQARLQLSGYGFEIGELGSIGFSIVGEKQLFEKVFRTRLIKKKSAGLGPQKAYFETRDPIKVPNEMTSLIDDIVFPRPPELFP